MQGNNAFNDTHRKKSCPGHFTKETVLCKGEEISSTTSNIYGGDDIEGRANEWENFLKTWEKTRNNVLYKQDISS